MREPERLTLGPNDPGGDPSLEFARLSLLYQLQQLCYQIQQLPRYRPAILNVRTWDGLRPRRHFCIGRWWALGGCFAEKGAGGVGRIRKPVNLRLQPLRRQSPQSFAPRAGHDPLAETIYWQGEGRYLQELIRCDPESDANVAGIGLPGRAEL